MDIAQHMKRPSSISAVRGSDALFPNDLGGLVITTTGDGTLNNFGTHCSVVIQGKQKCEVDYWPQQNKFEMSLKKPVGCKAPFPVVPRRVSVCKIIMYKNKLTEYI